VGAGRRRTPDPVAEVRALPGIVLFSLTMWLLAGCAVGPEPVDHHFRLIAEPPAALSAPALPGTLMVKRFSADGLLGQRPVVFAKATSPQTLHQYNYHFWADAPTVMLQELVAKVLRSAGVADQVTTPAHGGGAEHVLVGRIERLEHLVGETPAVIVALELGVYHGARRELVWLRSYVDQRPVGAAGVAAAASAMSDATSRILSRFLKDLAVR